MGKHKQIFLSESTRPRGSVFGMHHHLVDLYQVCSNYVPEVKHGTALGSNVLHSLILSEPLGLDISYVSSRSGTCQKCSNDALSIDVLLCVLVRSPVPSCFIYIFRCCRKENEQKYDSPF